MLLPEISDLIPKWGISNPIEKLSTTNAFFKSGSTFTVRGSTSTLNATFEIKNNIILDDELNLIQEQR